MVFLPYVQYHDMKAINCGEILTILSVAQFLVIFVSKLIDPNKSSTNAVNFCLPDKSNKQHKLIPSVIRKRDCGFYSDIKIQERCND